MAANFEAAALATKRVSARHQVKRPARYFRRFAFWDCSRLETRTSQITIRKKIASLAALIQASATSLA
jgi:hypothetical protein